MSLVPETPTEADSFARSVELASLLAGMGLPVAGARHAGFSLDVGFVTPRGAVGVVEAPNVRPGVQLVVILAQRAAGLGKAGWL